MSAEARRLDEVVRLLRSGQSLEEIQRAGLPESWRLALRVCAAAGTFDRDLYERLRTRHIAPDAPALDDLAGRNLIEAVGGDPPTWQVARADAASWMAEWQAEPRVLAEVEAEIAAWHVSPAERLRHLLVADPAAAMELFDAEFRVADRDRDFARCQDLIDVLGDPQRITYAGPEVAELRLERAGYLRARLFWSGAWSRSAQFLEPDGLAERADALLGGAAERVWQIFAPTGTGKTVQLQWLVARRCVPARYDIPCARVDFDLVDPVVAARYPWLLLLEIAEQLERRWARRVFERLDRFSSYRGMLDRQDAEPGRAAMRGLAAQEQHAIDRTVSEIFVRRFNDAAGARPVLLVVDTLEEVLLGADPDELLRMLARIVARCPSLRLVLAGRYDLRERAAAGLAGFGPVQSIALGDFSPEQTGRYLRELRHITDERLCTAVVERTGGHPFLVAMFADLIEEEPGTSPEDLRNYRDPALRLLIDRVIRRIPDHDVRWLVRYGVVPRRLHRNDLIEVMRPFLERNRQGPNDLDDPRQDEHHLSGRDDIFPFRSSEVDPARLERAWRRLLDYAAQRSWVSEPARDGRLVTFHQKVRAPMRELIARQPVARRLHLAFRDRFDRLAGEHPQAPAPFQRESFYHRVQLGEADAAGYWDARIRNRRAAGDLDGLAELARDVLSDDYVDADGVPLRRADGSPLVSHETVERAFVWLAYATVEQARQAGATRADPLWAAAEGFLSRAAAVRGGAAAATGGLATAMHAATLHIRGRSAEAAALVENALPDASEDDRIDLLRVRADAVGSASGAIFAEALALAERRRPDQVEPLALALARDAEAAGRFDRALGWCRRAGARGSFRARLREAELLIAAYQPGVALEVLTGIQPAGPAERSAACRVQARAHARLGDSTAALDALAAARKAADEVPGGGGAALVAEVRQDRGVLLGDLLQLDEAEYELKKAAASWTAAGFTEGHPECAYLHHRFLVRQVGDLRAAAALLRPAVAEGDRIGMLWDELTAERLDADRPQPVEGPPRFVAAVIAARLARSWAAHRHLIDPLLEAMERISPPSARLGVLAELARCADPVPASDVERLRPLLTWPPDRPDDAPAQLPWLAILERLAGNRERAARVLAGLPAAHPDPLLGRPLLAVGGGALPNRAVLLADSRYPLLRAVGLATEAAPELAEEAVSLCRGVSWPSRWSADIYRWAAVQLGDPRLRAAAIDLDWRLGRMFGGPEPERLVADGPEPVTSPLSWPPDLPRSFYEIQVRLVRDWADLAGDLGRALTGSEAVRLDSDDVLVHGLPWELAPSPGAAAALYRGMPGRSRPVDVRWLQYALNLDEAGIEVDGIMGPETGHALRIEALGLPLRGKQLAELRGRLAADRAARRPVAVVLRAESTGPIAPSSHEDYGYHVADLYHRSGYQVRHSYDLRQAPAALADSPTVLHVCARLDYRDSGPYFAFGGGADDTLEPSDVVRWLRAGRPGREPVLVLDPPYPGSSYDMPWQIMLRNLFAAHVFAEACVPAVFATGLIRTGGGYVETIAAGIARGASPLDAVRAIRPAGLPAGRTLDWKLDDALLAAQSTTVFAAETALLSLE
ncbi:hypothetical protein [Actinoplanes regularis]|uniref:AAA ATPase domain-containing protein n=1 Tax=Actinoplanes regularis TaxID=52697 RepID=A0A238W813_9ACTN|nr:hypothetical protein [Actinoplanes regularis]GIE85183.1 hypothetical protein Are01nite_16630 [Actinoplanes regularis]SNR42557.1 hypothetical protein SAMN06264365_102244 [Actinoplanes regularis]